VGLYGACMFSEHRLEFGQGAHDSATAVGDEGIVYKLCSILSYI